LIRNFGNVEGTFELPSVVCKSPSRLILIPDGGGIFTRRVAFLRKRGQEMDPLIAENNRCFQILVNLSRPGDKLLMDGHF